MNHQPRIVLTTCGTSVLTNGVRDLEAPHRDTIQRLLFAGANNRAEPTDPGLVEYIARRRANLIESDLGALRRASAEINGLAAIYGGDPEALRGSCDYHYLIATDTGIGKAAASVVASCMGALGLQVVETVVPAGLRTDDPLSFRGGVSDLMRHIAAICGEPDTRSARVVFHLSGAFKSIVGALVAAGMVYADEICMLFESSSNLMTIPRLPFDLEASVLSILGDNLAVVRMLGIGESVPVRECANLSESLFYEMDGHATLSEWGELIWGTARPRFYGERVWEPPSPIVAYEPSFLPSVARLTVEQRRLVNAAVDDLARHMAARRRGGEHNPRSLRVHAVRSAPPWFEAYPNLGDARRLYFRYVGQPEVIALDRLDDHL